MRRSGSRLSRLRAPLESANAFSSGKVDLAVVRGDVGDLTQAQAVVVLAQAVAMLVPPPGSSIEDMAGLKRVTVGVVAGETNQKMVGLRRKAYDLDRANVVFKDLAPADVRRALESKEVRAVLLVIPLAEKYLALVRGLFPQNAKTAPVLIPIEFAGAVAEEEHAYESFDIPKGTLRGTPPDPPDDITTLKVSFYLVAKKSLDNDLVAGLTQALMTAHRDLMGEYLSSRRSRRPILMPAPFFRSSWSGGVLQRQPAKLPGQVEQRDLSRSNGAGRARHGTGCGLEILEVR